MSWCTSRRTTLAEEDRRWRGSSSARSRPVAASRTLLYSYLTVPRFTAPRWYLEGGAVFMETWMGGGVGRAQGGYDEMVFRAMVQDDAHFFDPLGLASRGTQVDFPGRRERLPVRHAFRHLARLHVLAREVVAVGPRDEGSKRYYSDQFERSSGFRSKRRGRLGRVRAEFQKKNLAEVRKFPITPHRRSRSTAVGSISRMYYDEANATIYGAFRLPGVIEHVGALDTRDGSLRQLADIKRAMLYRVSSFAYDPQTGTAFYTNDNLALRDLMAVDVRHGETRMLSRTRASARSSSIPPIARSAAFVTTRLATLVRLLPLRHVVSHPRFPYESCPRPRHLADGRLLSRR
jgi:hypothetical protein